MSSSLEYTYTDNGQTPTGVTLWSFSFDYFLACKPNSLVDTEELLVEIMDREQIWGHMITAERGVSAGQQNVYWQPCATPTNAISNPFKIKCCI